MGERAIAMMGHGPVAERPRGMALRRAARTAVVLPAVFGLCLLVLDRKDMAVFAAFGSFALTRWRISAARRAHGRRRI